MMGEANMSQQLEQDTDANEARRLWKGSKPLEASEATRASTPPSMLKDAYIAYGISHLDMPSFPG